MSLNDTLRYGFNNLEQNEVNSKLESARPVSDVQALNQAITSIDDGILTRLFDIKAESLSKVNKTNSTEKSNISSLFNNNSISNYLNGVGQNITVLSSDFSSFVGDARTAQGAIQDVNSSRLSLSNLTQQFFGTIADSARQLLKIPVLGSSNRPDNRSEFALTPSETGQGLRLPNPLRDYSSYTYNIELAVLSPFEINSPEDSYRVGLTNSILRSGGGNYNNRVRTFNEESINGDAEYYIDDLEIKALMSPNPATGVTQGTNIRFSVTEPYSMGEFLQALQIGASVAKYSSYIEAPYVLKISFLGLDSNGNIVNDLATPPKFFPIKLTNIEFEVKGQGSVYECTAIAYNEMAFTTQLSRLRTDANISGRNVIECLEIGNPVTPEIPPLSLILNQRGQSIADAGIYDSPDKYIIMFPTDSQGATKAVTAARGTGFDVTQGATDTITETQARILGQDAGLFNTLRARGTQVIPDGAVYDVLRKYARENINEIGLSVMVADPNQDGDPPMCVVNEVIDEGNERLISNRGSASAQINETVRNSQYSQNTSIITVIEDIIMSSEYGRRLSEEQNEQGLKKWFRIEGQVFIEESPATQVKRGVPPRIFVYSVYPYYPDESIFQGSSQRSSNTELLKSNALKEYNYFYTGKNEDVLDFRIDFKTAFFQNLQADLGQHTAAMRTRGAGETVDPERIDYTEIAPIGIQPQNDSEPTAPVEEITGSTDFPYGGQRLSASVAAKRNIAQAFHDTLINSNVDLISAELEIWGDPFWIPESGSGNYNALPSGISPNLTADGTVTGQHSNIFTVINFRTPIDYDPVTGKMIFSTLVKSFSGLYMVTEITNYFNQGEFTQSLMMLRKRGQNDPPTGDTDVQQLGNAQIIAAQNRSVDG